MSRVSSRFSESCPLARLVSASVQRQADMPSMWPMRCFAMCDAVGYVLEACSKSYAGHCRYRSFPGLLRLQTAHRRTHPISCTACHDLRKHSPCDAFPSHLSPSPQPLCSGTLPKSPLTLKPGLRILCVVCGEFLRPAPCRSQAHLVFRCSSHSCIRSLSSTRRLHRVEKALQQHLLRGLRLHSEFANFGPRRRSRVHAAAAHPRPRQHSGCATKPTNTSSPPGSRMTPRKWPPPTLPARVQKHEEVAPSLLQEEEAPSTRGDSSSPESSLMSTTTCTRTPPGQFLRRKDGKKNQHRRRRQLSKGSKTPTLPTQPHVSRHPCGRPWPPDGGSSS